MAKPSSTATTDKAASAPQRRAPRTLNGTTAAAENAARVKAIALYESAIKLVHAGKYEKAHAALNEMLSSAPADLASAIRTQIEICTGHLNKSTAAFSSPEERYDYAISLLNESRHEEARGHFEQILAEHSDADYAFYGLALLAGMTDDPLDCIDNLREAIRLNPQNRFQARGDSDFNNVADDPRFTELLYPEA